MASFFGRIVSTYPAKSAFGTKPSTSIMTQPLRDTLGDIRLPNKAVDGSTL